MNLDITTILIGLVALGLIIMVAGLLLSRKPASKIERRPEGGDPYVASSERPYMKFTPAGGEQEIVVDGQGVAGEIAQANVDVAGEVLGVAATQPAAGDADDLSRLKGVGPKFVARLNELGVTRYAQLAGLNETEAAHLDARMGPFVGRLARDRVIEQADYLSRGDIAGFEEKFGKLGG